MKKARSESPDSDQPSNCTSKVVANDLPVLNPYPFFYYQDFSHQADPDSLTPLTLPGRVPNFPAKMHAILSRHDLSDLICWMPHGRSWKVIKPREFEVRVIPTYFEHAKFSSFVRQANGWGFRRISSGRDRNSYYHPRFLRGLPHLCKDMKRLGVAQKTPVDPDHEPNLFKISDTFPVPKICSDNSVMLHSTVMNGPRARISIDSILPHRAAAYGNIKNDIYSPHDLETLSAFQQSLVRNKNNGGGVQDMHMSNVGEAQHLQSHPAPTARAGSVFSQVPANLALAAANQMAFSSISPFAAGFATAASMSEQQMCGMMVAQKYFYGTNAPTNTM